MAYGDVPDVPGMEIREDVVDDTIITLSINDREVGHSTFCDELMKTAHSARQ